jgi:hypothetical protein
MQMAPRPVLVLVLFLILVLEGNRALCPSNFNERSVCGRLSLSLSLSLSLPWSLRSQGGLRPGPSGSPGGQRRLPAELWPGDFRFQTHGSQPQLGTKPRVTVPLLCDLGLAAAPL